MNAEWNFSIQNIFSDPRVMRYKPITLQSYDLELNVRKVKTDKIPLCVFGSLNWATCE